MRVNYRRRQLVRGIAFGSTLGMLPLAAVGANSARRLSFYHTHTGETLAVDYFADGNYLSEALSQVNHLLRDHRTDEVRQVDPQLLDLLHAIQQRSGKVGRYEVISGYRSEATNQMLRSRGGGVAKRSLHMQGRAIDVRIPGLGIADLQKAALELSAGGVGYYPSSEFVHIDTGPVRAW